MLNELVEIELFLDWNCVFMLNWIVWNRTVYKYKNGFGINNLQWLMCHKTKPNKQTFGVVAPNKVLSMGQIELFDN